MNLFSVVQQNWDKGDMNCPRYGLNQLQMGVMYIKVFSVQEKRKINIQADHMLQKKNVNSKKLIFDIQ